MKKQTTKNNSQNKLIQDCVNRVMKEIKQMLVETHMHSLYHFMSLESLKRALYTGFLELSDVEADYNNYGDETFSLSTTRQRNTSQGYPYMVMNDGGTIHNLGDYGLFIRAELDGEAVRKYGNVKPFDWMYHESPSLNDSGLRVNGKQDMMSCFDEEDYLYRQPWSQAEERIFSKQQKIPFDRETVIRVDIWFDPSKIEPTNIDTFMQLFEEYKNSEWIFFYYKDKNRFHLQKNPETQNEFQVYFGDNYKQYE